MIERLDIDRVLARPAPYDRLLFDKLNEVIDEQNRISAYFDVWRIKPEDLPKTPWCGEPKESAEKESNYSVNYDPIIKVTDDGGLTASQVAVADYKKRLVEKLQAASGQGSFRVSYSRVLELVEETD